MSTLFICPLSALESSLRQSKARFVIGFSGPGREQSAPSQATGGYLSLVFNDIGEEREGLIAPTKDHVAQIIAFAKRWDQRRPMLLHCWMGISRSTAAALIASLALDPNRDAFEAAQGLRKRAPSATPNPLMISHADALLKKDGTLIEAVSSIGRGVDAYEGTPFEFPLIHDASV